MQIISIDDLQASRVDHLALLVHHLVVLEDLFAGLGIATFDGVLRSLDRLGHHLRFDGLVVGQRPIHHPVDCSCGEEPHQVILERQEESALAGLALPA